ncbi:hypothetical protein ACHAW5_005976 [Stephanodiscus triporus]|uniref:Uncharacterized protein n=1 Tax=Stephanodiscus triporus TaxID=2934178 RepID=A0ABD3MC81_9STRA
MPAECTFCATGNMGKLCSLTTEPEILAQLFFAEVVLNQAVYCEGAAMPTAEQTRLRQVVCNLIPYNDIGSFGMGYRKPPGEQIIAFQEQDVGVRVQLA